ncbi:MAG: pitrilysin family protein [Steroidobacteraceae bacterium]
MAAQAADAVRMPSYQRVVLANGATLLLMERHDVPLIAFQATLRGGVLTDTAEKAGGANLLAQLLMKGAGQRNALQFAEAVAQVGGSFDTGVATESFSVDGQFMARDQALLIELLADVLQRPRLEQGQFNDLRQRQIEFLRAAKDSNVGALIPTYAAAALFGEHPYGRPLSGSETTLSNLQYSDVQQLYQQQFGADRLIIAVAGDFDTKALLQQLRRAFGSWHKARTTLPVVKPAPATKGRQVLLIDAPDAVQTYFWIGNVGVAHNYEQRVALELVNTLFGGRFTSMLNTELRIKTGLTYGARAQLRQPTQPGSWNMYSFTQSATSIQAIDLALQTYQQLRDTGLDVTALNSGKNYLLGQYPTDYETAAQWASTLADLEFYRLPRGEVDAYADRLRAVTQGQVSTVISSALPASENLQFVLIGKAATLRSQVAKYGTVTEMSLAAPTFAVSR